MQTLKNDFKFSVVSNQRMKTIRRTELTIEGKKRQI